MSIKGFDLDKMVSVRDVLAAIEPLAQHNRRTVEARLIHLLDHGDGFSLALLDDEDAA